MIKDEYLTDDQFETKYLMSLKKEELVSRLQALNDTRKELAENLLELRQANKLTHDTLAQITEKLATSENTSKTLWRIIQKCFDVKDLLDDLEDTAEEINEAAKILVNVDEEAD